MKNLKKRDRYLIVAIFNLTWYTVAMIWLANKGQQVPDVVTVGWFAAWTVELAALAKITCNKQKGDTNNDN